VSFSINQVMLVGYLGKDPDLTITKAGTKVVSFSLATTDRFKDKDGNEKTATDWHQVRIWGPAERGKYTLADFVHATFVKGDAALVIGKLKSNSSEYNGSRRTFIEVHAHVVNKIEKTESEDNPYGAP
jgi:single-strand DNA-binding protein